MKKERNIKLFPFLHRACTNTVVYKKDPFLGAKYSFPSATYLVHMEHATGKRVSFSSSVSFVFLGEPLLHGRQRGTLDYRAIVHDVGYVY